MVFCVIAFFVYIYNQDRFFGFVNRVWHNEKAKLILIAAAMKTKIESVRFNGKKR